MGNEWREESIAGCGTSRESQKKINLGASGDSGETKLVPGNLSGKKQMSELEGPERAWSKALVTQMQKLKLWN